MRLILFFAAVGVAFTFASAQSQSRDSQALESLVKEVRQLRQDLVTTTVAAQRVEIVLYRLQGQQTAVQRAAERRDLARDRVTDTESQIKRVTADLQRNEDQSTQSPERKELQEQLIPRLKADLETLRHLQQRQQASEADSEENLRAEQAKLTDLENFLDKLDKSLAEFDHPSH